MAKLSRISPEIPVRDVPEAIDQYRNQLGFELAAEFPGGDYAIVERDGIALHLFQRGPGEFAGAGVHIFTSDLDELHDELKGRCATICQAIERKPWGNREFRVKDCSGNTLKFTELSR